MCERPRSPRRRPDDEASATLTYEVGYGRPPLASQFKPGQCGNPKGRPRKDKSLTGALARELDSKVTVREAGKPKRLTKRELTARQLADAACRGDPRSIRLISELTGAGRPAGESMPSAQPQPSAQPLDGTDREILADFAALIRSGGILSGEPRRDPSVPADPLPDLADPPVDPAALPSPTRH